MKSLSRRAKARVDITYRQLRVKEFVDTVEVSFWNRKLWLVNRFEFGPVNRFEFGLVNCFSSTWIRTNNPVSAHQIGGARQGVRRRRRGLGFESFFEMSKPVSVPNSD